MAKEGSVRRLDTGYFETAIAEINKALEGFVTALNNIKHQTTALQECWDSAGADKFNNAYNRLKQEFDDQADNLTAIRDDLQTMLETYQRWDAEAGKFIAGEE